MATTFRKRLEVWLQATRYLIAGAGDNALPVQVAPAEIAQSIRDRYATLATNNENAHDPRVFVLAGNDQDPHGQQRTALRIALLLALLQSMDKKTQAIAVQSFRQTHPTLGTDMAQNAIDVFLSTQAEPKNSPTSVNINTLSSTAKHQLLYWAAGTHDDSLFESLGGTAAVLSAQKRREMPTGWLGWCVLMGRDTLIDKAILAGQNVDTPHTLSDHWIRKATMAKNALDDALQTLGVGLDQDERQAISNALRLPPALSDGFNALRWAVDFNDLACTERLLYHGANTGEYNQNHQTVLDRAIEQQAWDAASILSQHGALIYISKDGAKSFERLADIDAREFAAIPAFTATCDAVVNICMQQQGRFHGKDPHWGAAIIACARNPNVSPTLLEGIFDRPDVDLWNTWYQQIRVLNPETQQQDIVKQLVAEVACLAGNSLFMTMAAGKGQYDKVNTLMKETPLLFWVAQYTPDALATWIKDATLPEIEDALQHGVSTYSDPDHKKIWTHKQTPEAALLQGPKPEVVLQALLDSAPIKKTTNKVIRLKDWINAALETRSLTVIKALESTMGIPKLPEGTYLPGWAKIILRPRNEALLDHLLEQGWPVDVDLQPDGQSLVLAAAEMKDSDLVRRLVFHGANPRRESRKTISLEEWLTRKSGNYETIRAAVAEGTAQRLQALAEQTRPDTHPTGETYDRKM